MQPYLIKNKDGLHKIVRDTVQPPLAILALTCEVCDIDYITQAQIDAWYQTEICDTSYMGVIPETFMQCACPPTKTERPPQ